MPTVYYKNPLLSPLDFVGCFALSLPLVSSTESPDFTFTSGEWCLSLHLECAKSCIHQASVEVRGLPGIISQSVYLETVLLLTR